MVPGRGVGRDLEVGDRRAAGFQHGERVALGVEGVHRVSRGVPVAPVRLPGAQAGRDLVLAGRRVVAVLRPDLEQRSVAQALVGVARGGLDQGRQHRGAHDDEVGRDRIDQSKIVRHAAEQLGLGLGDEGEGDRLVQAAPGERRARQVGEALAPGQGRVRQGGFLGQRHHGNGVEAVEPEHLLDQVRLALHVGAPGRHPDLDRLAASLDPEAEAFQDARAGLGR